MTRYSPCPAGYGALKCWNGAPAAAPPRAAHGVRRPGRLCRRGRVRSGHLRRRRPRRERAQHRRQRRRHERALAGRVRDHADPHRRRRRRRVAGLADGRLGGPLPRGHRRRWRWRAHRRFGRDAVLGTGRHAIRSRQFRRPVRAVRWVRHRRHRADSGEQYDGGNGAGSGPDPPGRGAVAAGGGGGGGGGYFGGGGGTCQVYVTGYPSGAGGGGSGYVEVGTVSHGRTVAGQDATAAGLDRNARPAAAAMRSPVYRPGIGWGGGGPGAANGGNGQIVIEWAARPEAGKARLHRTRAHRTRARPAPHSRPGPRPRPTPAPLAGRPGHDARPRSGFPYMQVGTVALVLIGLGVIVSWAGGRRPEQ